MCSPVPPPDDPDLTSLALSVKGSLAWVRGDAHEVIALSRAAGRDQRVHVTQQAFNAYQQTQGWAMTGMDANPSPLVPAVLFDQDATMLVLARQCRSQQSRRAVTEIHTTVLTRGFPQDD